MSEERRPHIIAAAKRAISNFGIDGATQERIAEEAGMSRAHIRHYLGNRDELLDAVWEATTGDYVRAVDEATNVANSASDVRHAVDQLLELSFVYEEDDAVILAFLHESREDERVRARTHATYRHVEDCVGRLLGISDPRLSASEIESRAHAVMALSMGALMLDLLNPQAPRAERLIAIAADFFPVAGDRSSS